MPERSYLPGEKISSWSSVPVTWELAHS